MGAAQRLRNAGNPANWSGNRIPIDIDDAFIGLPAGQVVTFGTGNNPVTATISSLTAVGPDLTQGGGTLTIQNQLTTDGAVRLTGGSLVLNGTSKIGGLTQTAGTVAGTGALTVTGASRLINSASQTGTGTTILQGNATIGTADQFTGFNLDAGRTLQVSGAGILLGNQINFGLNGTSTPGSGTLKIAAGGTLDDQTTAAGLQIFTNNFGLGDGGTDASVVNLGTFKKTGAAATSTIGAAFDNDGTVDVQQGTLVLNGATIDNTGGILAANGGDIQTSRSVAGGQILIAGDSEVDLGIGSAVAVDFAPTGNGVLKIATPPAEGMTLSGFSLGDTIILPTLLASTFNGYAPDADGRGGTLTVVFPAGPSAGLAVDIRVFGNYAADSFVFTQTSPNTSTITLNPLTTPPPAPPALPTTAIEVNGQAPTTAGPAGTDTFTFKPGLGTGVISKFDIAGPNHDTLQFSRSQFADWTALAAAMTDTAGGAQIQLGASDTVTINGMTKSLLTAYHLNDILFV